MRRNGQTPPRFGDVINASVFGDFQQLQSVMLQRDREILGGMNDPQFEELAFQDFPEPELCDPLPIPEPEDEVETKADVNSQVNGDNDSIAQDIDSSEDDEKVVSDEDSPEDEFSPSLSILKLKAYDCVQRNAWREAIDLYTEAIEMQPVATLYGNRSLCYMKIGDYDEAYKDCCTSLELDPYYKRIHRRRATISLVKKDYPGASTDLQNMLLLSYDSSQDDYLREVYKILLPLARWVKKHGSEPTEEFKNLEKSVLTKLYDVQLSAAKAYKRKQMWAQVVECWSMAVIVAPPSGMLFAERGLANFKLGRNIAAESDLTEAISLEPSNSAYYRLRADVRKKLGNASGGESDLTRSKELGSTTDVIDSTSLDSPPATSAPPRRIVELPEPKKPTPTFRIPVHDVFSSSADVLYDLKRLPDPLRSLLFS